MPPQIFTTDELKAMPLDTKGYIYLTVAEEYWRSLGHGTSKDIEEEKALKFYKIQRK